MAKTNITIDKCQETAKLKGGKCLSTEYKNNHTKLKWECSKKHIWEASFANVYHNNSWCRICAGFSNYTIQDCVNYANNKNGKCLSIKYINHKEKMEWQCNICNHQWKACFNSIINNSQWCPKCAKNIKLTINECYRAAKEKNGSCLSTEYKNAKTSLIWQCDKLHIWTATIDSIKNRDTWCPKCSLISITIEECKEYATKFGGECLSTEHTPHQKTMWKCKKNHIWKSCFYFMKAGKRWCPECFNLISKEQEAICELLQKTFSHLNIILNDKKTIKPLHLDIYIPSIKFAIEYDGEYWHYSEWAIKEKNSLVKMARKNAICEEREIMLLRIRESIWLKNKVAMTANLIDQINYLLTSSYTTHEATINGN